MDRLRHAEELRRRARVARLDSLDRRRRAGRAGARRRDSRAARSRRRRPPATRSRASRYYLGRWIRSTDWYPDFHVRLYDRRTARWSEDAVHESIQCPGRVERLRGELLHYPYRDVSEHLAKIDRYTTLIASQWAADGRRDGGVGSHRLSAARLPAQLHPAPRLPRRPHRPGRLAAELVLRLPEIREAVRDAADRQRRTGAGAGRRARLRRRAGRGLTAPPMFSLHVDTARTWRGGQNQVLVTVLGLRALGHRTALVAHPSGELRRRAEEGLDFFPLAPRTEMDLTAAWRLSRLLKQLRPDVVHAHDPHGVAMAALALSMSTLPTTPRLIASRRVDFHLRGSALSRWKYRQVDCFICASEAIRHDARRRRHPAAAHGDRPRRHRPRAGQGRAAGGAAQGALAAARRPDRRQRRGARAAQGPEVPGRRDGRGCCTTSPTRASSSPAKASCTTRWRSRSGITTSRSTSSSPVSDPTSSRCTRRSTSS